MVTILEVMRVRRHDGHDVVAQVTIQCQGHVTLGYGRLEQDSC